MGKLCSDCKKEPATNGIGKTKEVCSRCWNELIGCLKGTPMSADDIAMKYVHGFHDALTDSQEKIDMANDIREYANKYHREQLLMYLEKSTTASGK